MNPLELEKRAHMIVLIKGRDGLDSLCTMHLHNNFIDLH